MGKQLRILSQMQMHTAYATSLHGEIMSLVKETSRIRSSIKNARDSVGNETIHDVIGTIPPKEICDELVQHYATLFEPMFRILHMPTFWAEYQTFWENREAVDKAFSLKLVMILTIGSIFCQDRVESERIRALARGWIYAVQWWLMGPTERVATSMDGVQVFCLLIIARQSNSLGGSRSITTESLLKLALLLGLHLDPSTFPSLTVFQQEMRRRLWATVLELMVMTSLDTTLPMPISSEESTTRPPANINDSDIDPQTKEMPLERPRSDYTDCSVSILLQESLNSRLRVVRKLNNTTSKISYEDTVKFGHDLGQHCRNVSRFFQNVATSGTRETTFHRKFIDSYVRRFWLFVSRLFALQARKDPRYLFARKSCLECCQIIASHSESLQLPGMVVDDFALLAMKGSGLYKGPLSQDIIVTLGLEISTQLEEEVESSKGIIDTLDPLFQLSQASRRPVIDILRHIHGQLRHIIALGRPSCKRYVMLSAILAQIDTFDSGLGDTRTEMLRVLKESIEECRGLLQGIHEKESAMNTASTPWTDGSDSWLDSMGLFGFDMNSMVKDNCNI
ncbi:hypothetical protein G7054_g5634 [Neopestalotiopsis clavispora]|nr:hypothetical protein G7054_g5634 [Neopestalotiopsis clavispora]